MQLSEPLNSIWDKPVIRHRIEPKKVSWDEGTDPACGIVTGFSGSPDEGANRFLQPKIRSKIGETLLVLKFSLVHVDY